MRKFNISSLARALRKREVSAVELTQECIQRIKRLDPALGAFKLVLEDEALKQAQGVQLFLEAGRDLGPLHGIPFAVKDLFDVAGTPTTAGSPLLEGNVVQKDSSAVKRLVEAGMVLVGKTHTVQFAYGGVGINSHYGTPKNPWVKDHHVPGGSSSGSAVAVAAGMIPAALGTDTGGSVRIPSSLCGITGLKTTVGLIPTEGVYPLSWTLDSVGPMAQKVLDVALLYEGLTGSPPADPARPWEPPPWLSSGVKGVRMGIPRDVFWDEVDEEVYRWVMGACQRLKELGAKVEDVEFPVAREACELARRGAVLASEAYAVNRRFVEEAFDKVDPFVAFRLARAREISGYEYVEANRKMMELRVEAAEVFEGIDVLLVPTTRLPALPLKEVSESVELYGNANWAYLRNTSIGNILNLCGLSVPCGFTAKGLPIGLMIYGRPFGERCVLRVGYVLQEATDWHLKEPDLSWI